MAVVLIVTRRLLAWGVLQLATCCLKKTRPAWQSFAYPIDLFVLSLNIGEEGGYRLDSHSLPAVLGKLRNQIDSGRRRAFETAFFF